MKALLIALSCVVSFTSPALSFADDKQSDVLLLPFHDGKQWGYMNRKGKTVIAPQFDWADDFAEGFAFVHKSHQYSFIDKSGKTRFAKVLSKYQIEHLFRFSEGRAWFAAEVGKKQTAGTMSLGIEWKYGLIDNNGRILIEPKFSAVYKFSEGLASVGRYSPKTQEMIWGFIDRSGKEIIKPKFASADNFSEGLAVVQTENGNFQYIDKFGKVKFPLNLEKNTKEKWNIYAAPFSDGLANVLFQRRDLFQADYLKREKVGYIDKKGNWVIKPFFGRGGDFSEGLAATFSAESEKWGYLDQQGKWIIKPQFDGARDFSDGLATVLVVTFPNHKRQERWGIIDKKGEFQVSHNKEMIWFNKSNGVNKAGYVNGVGRSIETSDPLTWELFNAFHFPSLHSGDLLRVHIGGKVFSRRRPRTWKGGGWYYIDKKGNVIGLYQKDD